MGEKSLISPRDIEMQKDFAVMVRDIVNNKSIELGRNLRACVVTYGCQQNFNDSGKIMSMVCDMGYEICDDRDAADLIIFNTCAVREAAELRVFGNIGALVHNKRKKPDLKIAVCGCMMQIEKNKDKIKSKYRHVDVVFGTHTLYKLPEIMLETLVKGQRVFDVIDSPGQIVEDIEGLKESEFSAGVTIMYGCNNYCSYCIVPYVRGRERSRQPDMIYSEVKRLVKSGVKEILLLGQNVNSYGLDLGIGVDFSDLLDNVCKIEGDFRVRFMTSHPKDANIKLFKTMAANKKVVKHLHLPIQAGDDGILELMNRGYTSDKYMSLISSARSLMPELTVTSDVIVGFPSESYEQFLNTLDVVKKVRFDSLYTFIYSKRTGTPAEKMDNQVPPAEKKKRLYELMDLQNAISLSINKEYVGKIERVLALGASKTNENMMTGKTDGGKTVNFEGHEKLTGQFLDLLIIKAHTWSLYGKILKTGEERHGQDITKSGRNRGND